MGITRPDRPLLAVSSRRMAWPIWPRASVTILQVRQGYLLGSQAGFDRQDVKSHPTPTPGIAAKGDPINRAETGVAEPQIAKQSRSWRAAIGEREIMRGS